MRYAVLALVVASSLLACEKDLVMKSPTEVDLDVWSGRPNPTWTLTPEEEVELAKHLRDLEGIEKAVEPPALGYRGFVLSSPGRRLRVYRGTLVLTEVGEGGEDGATHVFADSNGLERWLAELAAKRGHGDLVAAPT